MVAGITHPTGNPVGGLDCVAPCLATAPEDSRIQRVPFGKEWRRPAEGAAGARIPSGASQLPGVFAKEDYGIL